MEIFQWIWPGEIFSVVWISSFRKINPSSLWITNRGEFRQDWHCVDYPLLEQTLLGQ